jgi:hypothetical protein
MEVISLSEHDRLSPDQKDFWDYLRPYACEPTGKQTPEQAINLAVSTFVAWCHFERIGSTPPTPTAIRAEFEAAGVPEACPSADFLEELQRDPESLNALMPRPEDSRAIAIGPTAAAAMNYPRDRAREGHTTVIFLGPKGAEAMRKQLKRKADREGS